MGREIAQAIEASTSVVHPLEKAWKGIGGTIFTAPPRIAADLRSATILGPFGQAGVDGEPCRTVDGAVLRRSPGVTGTCALLAVLDAMGLLSGDQPFTHEGLLGTSLQARVVSRQASDDIPFVVPAVEGSAWMTGRHEFDVEEGDPLKEGFGV